MVDRPSSPLGSFMKELRASNNSVSVKIECDNAKSKPQHYGISTNRASSLPSMSSTSNQPSRWDVPPSTNANVRWGSFGESMDLHQSFPGPQHPQRRGSVERLDFPDYQLALFNVQQKDSTQTAATPSERPKETTGAPPKCPARRDSVEKTDFPDYQLALFNVQQKYATTETASVKPKKSTGAPPKCPDRRGSKDFSSATRRVRLPDYKLALKAAQQKYGQAINRSSSSSTLIPILPIRRESLEECNLLEAACKIIQ